LGTQKLDKKHTLHCLFDVHLPPDLADMMTPVEGYLPPLPKRFSSNTTQRLKTLSLTSFEQPGMTTQRQATFLWSTTKKPLRREQIFSEASVSLRVM
jgi:hypothetical protein